MSINYYFIDKVKAKENKDIVSKLDFIDKLTDQIINTELIGEWRRDEIELKVDDFKNSLLLNVELPEYEIHICQNAFGWITLFEAKNQFKNFDELENFYKNNKDDLDIVDEYGRILSWEELEQQIKVMGKHRGDYIDNHGYAWMEGEFS